MRINNVFLVILCALFSVSHIFAAENPYKSPYRDLNAVSACDGGPSTMTEVETCTIDGDLPNPTLNSGNTTEPCRWVEEEINQTTGQIIPAHMKCVSSQTHTLDQWFEWGKKPAATYNIQPLTDMMEGARLPLTPLSIWEITKRNTNLQKDEYWALRCDFKQQNSDPRVLVREDLSDEKMAMGPYTNLSTALEDAEAYQTYWTWASKSDQNYQKATEKLSANVYPCGYSRDATETQPKIAETQGRGIWELIKVIFMTILRLLEARNVTESIYTETSRKPHSENISGVLINSDEKIFENSRVSETRKAAIRAKPGIVETFRPCGLKFEPDDYNGEILNEYQWGTSGEQFEQLSRQHQTNLWESSTNYLKSTLLPAQFHTAKQKKPLDTKPCGEAQNVDFSTTAGIPPSEPNTSEWTNPPSASGTSANPINPDFTPPSSITAGDATGLVPACVLEGVAKIEGAYDGGAPCTPNECGAYGPFQITIGNCKPSCGASSCPNAAAQLGVTKDVLCDFNSAAYQAARLLVGKANYWKTPISATAPISSQKAAIINGADSYYGVGAPISRLGGLSYGEWVYQHCSPSEAVVHVEHKVGHYPGTP